MSITTHPLNADTMVNGLPKWPETTEWNNIGCWHYNSHINKHNHQIRVLSICAADLEFYTEQYCKLKIFSALLPINCF